ncbi:hypothetical protein, partial [Serratia marcescens]|uniref:hypothetical protein n=1 Tax=Serratia marcescens TaxID=615 RepID=UPI001F446445
SIFRDWLACQTIAMLCLAATAHSFFWVFIGSGEFTKSRFFVLSVVYRWLMSNHFIMVCFQITSNLYEKIKV